MTLLSPGTSSHNERHPSSLGGDGTNIYHQGTKFLSPVVLFDVGMLLSSPGRQLREEKSISCSSSERDTTKTIANHTERKEGIIMKESCPTNVRQHNKSSMKSKNDVKVAECSIKEGVTVIAAELKFQKHRELKEDQQLQVAKMFVPTSPFSSTLSKSADTFFPDKFHQHDNQKVTRKYDKRCGMIHNKSNKNRFVRYDLRRQSSEQQPSVKAHSLQAQYPKSLNTEFLVPLGDCVALDCEMVGVGPHKQSILARVSMVNHVGDCVLDVHVKVHERVTDYRTHVSGIRPGDLTSPHALEFGACRHRVMEICNGKVLVGHGLENDLKVLRLHHPWHMIRDTSRYVTFMRRIGGSAHDHADALPFYQPRRLRDLTRQFLGTSIQAFEHDSLQDAKAAMSLYKLVKTEWDHWVCMSSSPLAPITTSTSTLSKNYSSSPTTLPSPPRLSPQAVCLYHDVAGETAWPSDGAQPFSETAEDLGQTAIDVARFGPPELLQQHSSQSLSGCIVTPSKQKPHDIDNHTRDHCHSSQDYDFYPSDQHNHHYPVIQKPIASSPVSIMHFPRDKFEWEPAIIYSGHHGNGQQHESHMQQQQQKHHTFSLFSAVQPGGPCSGL